MYCKYTVALCDILGFSCLVKSSPINVVVDDVLGWFRKALHHSINKNNWPSTVPTFDEIDKNSKISLAWFSDTILLFTREDTDESLQELIQTLEWLIFATMNYAARIRAGVGYGDAFIDQKNAIYVGVPIIEAYQLEQQQQWSGAALTKSAVNRVPVYARNGEFADWPVIPYRVPLKKDKSFNTLAINWTYGLHNQTIFHWSSKSKEPTKNDWLNQPSVCEKWKNTKKFHSDVCKQCHMY